MKKNLLICFLMITVIFSAEAQKKKKKEWQSDNFGFTFSQSFGILPIKLSGLMENSYGSSTIINGQPVKDKPDYAIKDTTGVMTSIAVLGGLNIPFYRTQNWSMGAKLNVGIGYLKNLVAAEGLEGLMYDFPQFLYYRNYKNKFDYSLLLGYKYTAAALPYQLALGGIEFNINNKGAIRLYSGLNSDKYYRYFTDGRTEPALWLKEFGITITKWF